MNDFKIPVRGAHNPSSDGAGTTPGSFANAADIGGPRSFSSPDTPGMPQPSTQTAWDFMPEDWRYESGRWHPPVGFVPVTQLEHARLGTRHASHAACCRTGGPSQPGAGARRGGGRPDDHPGQQGPSRARARPDVHRTRGPHENQREHGRVTGLVRHRRGSRKASVGRTLGRRHRHGPVDGRRPRRDPRSDHRSTRGCRLAPFPSTR